MKRILLSFAPGALDCRGGRGEALQGALTALQCRVRRSTDNVLQADVAFLQKPFTIAALTKKVRHVLDESQA
jgi:hypothetical protein